MKKKQRMHSRRSIDATGKSAVGAQDCDYCCAAREEDSDDGAAGIEWVHGKTGAEQGRKGMKMYRG